MPHRFSPLPFPEVIKVGGSVRHGKTRERYQSPHHSLNIFSFPCRVIINDVSYEITPGMVSWMPPGTDRVLEFSAPRSPHRVIHFRLQKNQHESQPMVYKLEDLSPCVFSLYELSLNSYEESDLHTAGVHLWSMLHLLPSRKIHPSDKRVLPAALTEILDTIESTPISEIDLSFLLKKHSISRVKIHRLFTQHLRQSPGKFLQDKRVALAWDKLTQTEESIKSIAIECGYPGLQHFNKRIHQAFNCSPRTLREQFSTFPRS